MPLSGGLSADDVDQLAPYGGGGFVCRTINPTHAVFKLFDQGTRVSVDPGSTDVTIELDIAQTGVTRLEAWFAKESGEMQGAYYVYAERLTNSP